MNTQFTLLISSNRDVEVEEAIVVNYYLSFIFTIYFIELLLTQNIFFVTYVLLFHVASLTRSWTSISCTKAIYATVTFGWFSTRYTVTICGARGATFPNFTITIATHWL